MADGRPTDGVKGMGRVQMLVLRDLVTEGEWRAADKLPGTPRAHLIMMSLRRRGLARMVAGDDISGDAVYRPTDEADQWFVERGYALSRYADTPFIYLHTDRAIPMG